MVQILASPRMTRDKTVIRLPSMEKVRNDPVLYAHANRVLHLKPTRATPVRWCRSMASSMSGSTRRRFR